MIPSQAVRVARDEIIQQIDRLGEPMSRDDYRGFMEEVSSHLECSLEAMREEDEG